MPETLTHDRHLRDCLLTRKGAVAPNDTRTIDDPNPDRLFVPTYLDAIIYTDSCWRSRRTREPAPINAMPMSAEVAVGSGTL